jgi:hypothetical protein
MNGNEDRASAIEFTTEGAARMRARLEARSRRNGECLEWAGGRADNGYGVTGGALTGRPRRLYTHRVAYALANGDFLADNLVVRHTCDNRACIEPTHLVTGTTADNNADTIERWRGDVPYGSWTPRGTNHRSSKLDEDAVRQIRAAYAAGGVTLRALAAEHGVSLHSLWLVVQRKSWTHVE